jgi:hypothetical protein
LAATHTAANATARQPPAPAAALARLQLARAGYQR